MSERAPYIVGFGGTTRPNSSSERALKVALAHARSLGAETVMFTGDDLVKLPHYAPGESARVDVAERFVAELRRADGVIVSSPAYHGSVSGMLKNALDYVEDMREDPRVYFDGRSFGVIVTGYGWQAIVSTINTLRTIAHALRAWITPLGAGIDSKDSPIDGDGSVSIEKVRFQLETVAEEVVGFARQRIAAEDRPPTPTGVDVTDGDRPTTGVAPTAAWRMLSDEPSETRVGTATSLSHIDPPR